MTTLRDRTGRGVVQPAAGIEQHDVDAVNSKAQRSLYADRPSIHPKHAHGTFRRVKWIVMLATLGIYYGLPWIRWYRGPDLPDQAVLLDLPNNRFFFFFLEIWPQEFYYVTGLLVLGALGLFFVTSVAGRVWCGYTCPQTVWTDLMVAVERFWQGDRNDRIRLDKEPWHAVKIYKKTMTHLSWLAISVATGGALVFYFRDAPTLARELLTGTAPAVAYLFLGIFTATTYVLGGIAREQVCIYMCPWPRIQGAMTDADTMLIGYREGRGEPRGAARKGQDGTVDWSTRGDCIDCKACVAVCPTGIDIRDGSQLECIQCALCIDACNDIMDRIGRPRGLIAYDTIAQQEAVKQGRTAPLRLVRPRTMIYAGLFALVGAIMLVAWLNRSLLEVNALPDYVPPYVLLAGGGVRNGYTVKVLNKIHEPRTVRLSIEGLPQAQLTVVGADEATKSGVRVATDALVELRAYVAIPAEAVRTLRGPAVPFAIVVTDVQSNLVRKRTVRFQLPHAPEQR